MKGCYTFNLLLAVRATTKTKVAAAQKGIPQQEGIHEGAAGDKGLDTTGALGAHDA